MEHQPTFIRRVYASRKLFMEAATFLSRRSPGTSLGIPLQQWLAKLSAACRHHREVLTTVFTSFVVFSLFTLQGILLARVLGPEVRGEYGTCVLFGRLLLYGGMLGADHALALRAAKDKILAPGLRCAALRLGLRTGLLTAMLAALIALIALPEGKRLLFPLCLASTLLLPLEQMRQNLLAVDRGSNQFGRYNSYLLIGASVLPVLLLAVFFTKGSCSISLMVLLAIVEPGIGLAIYLASSRRGQVSSEQSPELAIVVREGLPFALGKAATDLFNRLDGFLMLWLASFVVQGYYAVAIAAADILLIAPTALALFAFNRGARASERPTRHKIALAGLSVALLQFVTASACLVILPFLIVFVFGDSFRDAVPLALACVPAAAINGVTCVALAFLRGRNQPQVEARTRAIGAVVMLLFVVIFHSRWQAMTVPFALCAGQLVTCLLTIGPVFRSTASARRTATQDSRKVLAS